MNPRDYITFLKTIEKLKCNTRHSWTSTGRRESVAEHSWRLALMAMLCADEYPSLDMDKVIKMCLIHDLGEAVTGDIPAFLKTEDDETKEENAVEHLLSLLPKDMEEEFFSLFSEMAAIESDEAKLFKALDNMEAIVSHNEAPLSTWLPLEYEENLVYGQKNADFSPWTKKLREELKRDTLEKIEKEK